MDVFTPEQSALLSLLAHTLNGAPLSVPDGLDWDALYREAAAQTVLPLACEGARSLLPDAQRARWEKSSASLVAQNLRIRYEHVELHELMAAAGIPYVTIKGACSASWYPDPSLRTMGDVDFLVAQGDLDRAGAALEAEGFTPPARSSEEERHWAYTRRSGAAKSVWEMHWSLFRRISCPAESAAQTYLDTLLESAALQEEEIGSYMAPSPFLHGLVMLVHTSNHLVNTGIGLRHLCDWAVFAERFPDGEFRALFEEPLKSCGLWRFAQVMTQLSVSYLGCTPKAWAMEDVDSGLLAGLMADIFASGNFGSKDDERINEGKLIANLGGDDASRGSFLRQFVRSMNVRARRAWPLLYKLPALLPLGWLYVGLRHLLRIRRGTRPTIHVSKMLSGAARRREIYRGLRLFLPESVP